MKENYFTRTGLDLSSFALNVAACRLVLDILPGLEIGVLNDTDGDITLLQGQNNSNVLRFDPTTLQVDIW